MFDYLCNYPLDGFDAEKPPMTEWKQELIGQNLNTVIEFLKYLWEGYGDQEMKIKADAMFLGYKEWSNNSGEHASGSNRAFYAELKKWGIVKKRMSIDDTLVHGFHMKKNDIVELLRKVLGNADFNL
jgi:phage/plasmid-associated DNA primase